MTTTTTTTTPERVERRSVVVDAAPHEVFALLADPSRHPELDGTGTVRALLEGPERLALGDTFSVRMKGYSTHNTVVELVEDVVVAWRHRGRHVWRWSLEPVDGGTRVTEEFDWSAKRAPRLTRLAGVPRRGAAALEATLAQLPQVLAAGGARDAARP